MQQLVDPGEELDVERLVEAERGADALELRRARIVAGEDSRGIAGRQPQQQEHDQRHHAHDGDGSQYAAKQISEHVAVLRLYTALRVTHATVNAFACPSQSAILRIFTCS